MHGIHANLIELSAFEAHNARINRSSREALLPYLICLLCSGDMHFHAEATQNFLHSFVPRLSARRECLIEALSA